jgi:hypothetical protein
MDETLPAQFGHDVIVLSAASGGAGRGRRARPGRRPAAAARVTARSALAVLGLRLAIPGGLLRLMDGRAHSVPHIPEPERLGPLPEAPTNPGGFISHIRLGLMGGAGHRLAHVLGRLGRRGRGALLGLVDCRAHRLAEVAEAGVLRRLLAGMGGRRGGLGDRVADAAAGVAMTLACLATGILALARIRRARAVLTASVSPATLVRTAPGAVVGAARTTTATPAAIGVASAAAVTAPAALATALSPSAVPPSLAWAMPGSADQAAARSARNGTMATARIGLPLISRLSS